VAPRPLRVLDVATGAGDLPLALGERFRRAGLAAEVSGCDISPVALAHARRRAAEAGAAARVFQADALSGPLPGPYDALFCSLFLHHLEEADAVTLLGRMRDAAQQLVLVNDLERGRLGYLLAWLGARLLTRCRVVHVDAPRSVENAFTRQEAVALAERAGLAG